MYNLSAIDLKLSLNFLNLVEYILSFLCLQNKLKIKTLLIRNFMCIIINCDYFDILFNFN